MMYIDADNEGLQYCGRIDFADVKAPVFVYAATYVKISFSGTSIKAVLSNNHAFWMNQMGYIIDGEQQHILLEDNKEDVTYTLCDNLPDTKHELMLFKRQDACHYVTFKGFILDEGAKIFPVTKKSKRRIEVYGDSVSCGEVSEAVNYVGKQDPEHNGQYSNCWYSYAWMTARKLKAELHDISQGGIALLDETGYFSEPKYKGIESTFDKIQYFSDLGPLKEWDFKKYTPQVVILAFGQNDNHPDDYMSKDCESDKSKKWKLHYKKFVEKLMKIYENAHIILTTTILMHDASWDKAIDEVCKKIDSSRVHHFLYTRNGAGTPGHIRIPEADEMAEELSAYINSLGEEVWANDN